MTKTEIAEKIKNMISENLRIPENMLDDDAELFGGDIGLDSVDSLEIISGIDDLFGVDMTGVDRRALPDHQRAGFLCRGACGAVNGKALCHHRPWPDLCRR